jgi:hypothetical protein
MKNVFSIIVICLTITVSAAAQKGWVYSESKAGKVTYKECEGVDVESDTVLFVVSKTSYQMFTLAGVDKGNKQIWVDHATNKVITRTVKDGKVIFWKTSKKAYYY